MILDGDDQPFGIPQGALVRTESRKSRSKFLRITMKVLIFLALMSLYPSFQGSGHFSDLEQRGHYTLTSYKGKQGSFAHGDLVISLQRTEQNQAILLHELPWTHKFLQGSSFRTI